MTSFSPGSFTAGVRTGAQAPGGARSFPTRPPGLWPRPRPRFPPVMVPPVATQPVVVTADRRTYDEASSSLPIAVEPDEGASEPGFDGEPTLVDAAPPTIMLAPPAGADAVDLWRFLMHAHLAARNAGASVDGEPYPETSVGDVRRAALRFSRALCLPRYDGANLRATRDAWRDACARVEALAAALPWSSPYPENERFWLSDTLALAQRLAEVDRRRSRNGDGLDLAASLGDRSDALTTWQDLRAYFLARRLARHDGRGLRYPETTVGDVRQIVDLYEVDAKKVLASLVDAPEARRAVVRQLAAWREVAAAVEDHAARLPATAAYPDNLRFWQATKKLALWLTTGAEVARERAPWSG